MRQHSAGTTVPAAWRDAAPGGRRTVADAMILAPKLCDPGITVGQARLLLRDEHVHALLLVDGGVLRTVLEAGDVAAGPSCAPALHRGRLPGRVVGPETDLRAAQQELAARGGRRLAVVDEHGVLLGLLCLKRSARGFCTDAGVAARAAEAPG